MKPKTRSSCPRALQILLLGLSLLLCLGSARAQIVPTPLTIQCPSNIVLWTCTSNITWQYPPPVITGGCPPYNVICEPPPGATFPLGVTEVNCRVVDSCQNVQRCTFTVTVRRDEEPPKITCPSNIVVRACPTAAGGCGTIVNYPDPIASDNSGSVAVTCIPPSGSFFPCGVTEVTCVAVDRCGNRDICRFTVTVIPGQAPGIQCPTDRVITTCSNSAVLTYPPPVVNPPGTTVICDPPPGTVLPLGVHTVTCIASNECGVARCEFKVTIRRAPQVSIQCPTNPVTYTIPCYSNCAPVNYTPPTVLNGALESCVPPPGTCLAPGEYTVVCRATNECGAVLCEFKLIVVAGQGIPPQITCPEDRTITTCSNSAPISYPPPVVFPAGTTVTCTPPPGTVLPVGSHIITCVASNRCGVSECKFTITIRRAEPPRIKCPDDLTLVTCSNCVPLRFPRPVVENGVLVSCDPPPGTCLPVGDHTVTCVASNECGTVRCEFKVRVVPGVERPTLSITKDRGYVIVCWTKACRCFKLQATRNLNRPIVWVDVPDEPTDFGDHYCLRIPISRGMRFFRLIECDRPTATVYDVTGLPITRESAGRLAEALEIPHDGLLMGDGSVRFLNAQTFQRIPTEPITDPAIIEELSQETENDKGELAFEGLDFAGLMRLRVPSGEEATKMFEEALRKSELLPANGELGARHTLFETFDAKGEPMMEETPIDTRASFHFDLGGIPLIGPGAKLNISFGPGGEPTSLLAAFRDLKPNQDIPILSIEEAALRCQKAFPQLGLAANPRLVYYAPPLSLPAVQLIIPCYDCGGEGVVNGEQVSLLRNLIPATDDPAFTPEVSLEASAQGTLVNAKADVKGGTPPYSYQWISSSVDLGGMFPDDASSIEYPAQPRDESRLETIKVIVTDANGVQIQASETVVLGPIIAGGLAEMIFTPAVGGVSDYGIERAVSDLCAAQQADFNARFMPEGYTRRFNWSGLSAWEKDFKEGGTGLDHIYVDNVDLTFYMGHGYGGGFTFEGSHDDGTLHYSDAVKAWGDIDLEWLALLSCSVMADTYDGKSCVTRWGPTFDGLHMMLGFANTAYDHGGFAGTFADWTLGRFHIFPPLPIRSAWFLATDSNQPSSVIASAMGVIGPGGCSNYNDYFWGKGPVGPDIRGSNILGYWRVKY